MTIYGSSRYNAVAALPTGTSMNPLHPETAEYFDKDQTAYVMFKVSEQRTRPTRVFTSFGNFPDWKIGTLVHFQHDQTGAYLGEYRVSGIHVYANGEMAGDVPDSKIKHCVAK